MSDGPGVILVTGGGRGIGAATARMAAERGYTVCVNYVTDRASAEAVGADTKGLVVQADVGNPEDVERLFKTIDQEYGRLDALVNNAGIPGPRSAIVEMEHAALEETLRTNVIGSFLCAKEAVRRMAKSNGGQGGAIVNVSSQAAVTGGYHLSAYAASKAAIETMTRSLCSEMHGENVRVNAISPGVIQTDQQDFSDPERLSRIEQSIPLGRIGTCEEVAEAILWLLSPAASYVNGAILPATGGR